VRAAGWRGGGGGRHIWGMGVIDLGRVAGVALSLEALGT